MFPPFDAQCHKYENLIFYFFYHQVGNEAEVSSVYKTLDMHVYSREVEVSEAHPFSIKYLWKQGYKVVRVNMT